MRASGLRLLLLVAIAPLPSQAMTRNVAISAGSLFAAALQCEANNLITPGQTEDLLKALDPYLSDADKANLAAGRTRGERDHEVFVDSDGKWYAFTPDDASCYRVQGVLDGYKAQAGE